MFASIAEPARSRYGEDPFRREQRYARALRRAYIENVGHEPPSPSTYEQDLQFRYGIPAYAGGYKQPRKADREDFIRKLVA